MPEDKDLPTPYTDTPFEQMSAYVDSLTSFGYYKPLSERLRELNARFMSNEKERLQDDS